MRLFQVPTTLLYTTGLLSFSTGTSATPFWWPKESTESTASTATDAEPTTIVESHNVTLELRGNCANPCGWYGQLCCETGQTCFTDANNQAQCGGTGASANTGGGGYWQYYTTTYVETGAITKTTVISSFIPARTVSAAGGGCVYARNESPCGNICCPSGQYCLQPGQCAPAGGGSSEGYAGSYTAPASAPLRPTTGTTVVATATGAPTTTVPFQTPVATGANITFTGAQPQHSGGLSGGAIAGIVIGVLAAIGLLFLICFCFCAKACLDLLKACFGGKRRKTTETVEEYHHHSSGGAAAAGGLAGLMGGRRWHGDRPSRPEKPQKSGLGGMGAMAAGLGALAVGLGLKRKFDKKHGKTEYTGSSYYSYYGTSTSESSQRYRV